MKEKGKMINECRFCGYCGKPLKKQIERSKLRYDRQTGEKLYDVWMICPVYESDDPEHTYHDTLKVEEAVSYQEAEELEVK